MSPSLSRRALLRGAGVALALPALESLLPRGVAHAGGTAPPKRMLIWYVPCGINGSTANAWRPTAEGAGFALSPMLAPLGALRSETLVLTGLSNRPAQADYGGVNDGAGDHARGTGSFLTAARITKTEATGIRNGISVDQVAANAIGMSTRFPSLQMGIDGGSATGNCDSGYSCAYARNISWASETTPLPKLTNPQILFERLFAAGESAAQAERRRAYRASVLDYVRRDATRLQGTVGATDRARLDQYLTAVRELERQVMAGATTAPVCAPPPRPMEGLGYEDTVRVMNQIMALALRCDATRVITFMLGNAGSGRDYSFLGAAGAHHELSHHQSDPDKLRKLQLIGTWEVQQFAALLQQLQSMREADGSTVLDNTVALFSSEIADGNGHWHYGLPVLLAGRCGGQFNTGRHVVYGTERPIANLYLAMLKAVGVRATRFGAEGTAVLENLGTVSTG